MEWTILQHRETFIAAIRKNLENAFASLCICFKYKWRRQEGMKKEDLGTWERLHVSQWFFRLRFISGYGFVFQGKIADFSVGCCKILKPFLQRFYNIFRCRKRKAFLSLLVALVLPSTNTEMISVKTKKKLKCEKNVATLVKVTRELGGHIFTPFVVTLPRLQITGKLA